MADFRIAYDSPSKVQQLTMLAKACGTYFQKLCDNCSVNPKRRLTMRYLFEGPELGGTSNHK
eukprot:2176701-Amphidinium_carterae.1